MANGRPYLGGERYAGPFGAYDDHIPPRRRGGMNQPAVELVEQSGIDGWKMEVVSRSRR
ncbi:hypothetical protein ACL02O_11920 [Micromonospora sp. MS34]|uniref:hypothetical protein n=1 Tax=Micromonospora sp. MS34 TaxID=3385971 RepID=UPI0039A169CE